MLNYYYSSISVIATNAIQVTKIDYNCYDKHYLAYRISTTWHNRSAICQVVFMNDSYYVELYQLSYMQLHVHMYVCA